VEFRPITAADIEACVDVFFASDEALAASRNYPIAARSPTAIFNIVEHIANTTPERAWLAEDDGSVRAFGMAAERGDLVYLSFLFVHPDAQATGVGRALYERSMPLSGYRATAIWSPQPISAAMYAREGLVPRVPIYTLSGRPRESLPALPPGLQLTEISQSELDDLDKEICGFTRAADHAAWQRWERRPFALREGASLVGYGYAQPAGRLGPAVVRHAEHLVPLVGALMAAVEPREDWMIHVPGPASELFAGLLRAGMRLRGAPLIFCATEARVDHSRYLPATFVLP